jgi:biopolymer transport protein ExbD
MDFGVPPSRPRVESVVPMINVVFLLLIFFLMTATIAPPDPFATVPPEAAASVAADSGNVLHVSADGAVAFGELRGEAALAAAAEEVSVTIRADARLATTELAGILARLAGAGVADVSLVTVRR